VTAHSISEQTILWQARENLSEKVVFFFLLYRMILDLPDSYGKRMVAVGVGLNLEAQSLRLTGVAIGKFDREVEQSSG
jgi:hypothetical protein